MLNGSKKQSLERVAMKHHETGELLVKDSEIKKGAVEYCISVLTNKQPEETLKKKLML